MTVVLSLPFFRAYTVTRLPLHHPRQPRSLSCGSGADVINAATGEVSPVNATDPDGGDSDSLIYTLIGGTGYDKFVIDEDTGVISVNQTANGACKELDYEGGT